MKSNTKNFKVRAGPDGLHFFDRNNGLNVLVDEVIPPSNLWHLAPRQVSIALTNACDLACSHCYAPKAVALLNFSDLLMWLTELDANGCFGVGLGGGEPTLYPKLVNLCSYIEKETRLAVTMTTHGHHLKDHLLEKLAGNIHFVRVSMDGVGQTYETIRSRSFDALIKRIEKLRTISRFGINFLVNKNTINDLSHAVQIATELGASEFLLLPEEPVGTRPGIDNDTRSILCKWIATYDGQIPLSVSVNHSDGLPTCHPIEKEDTLTGYVHIDAFGVVKRTSYDSTGAQIGNDGVMAAFRKLKEMDKESNFQ